MRSLILPLLLLLIPALHAQSYTATLKWTASTASIASDPGTCNVYRASGSCTAAFTKIATGVAPAGPYSDTTIVSGAGYCYYVTAVIGGVESAPSNTWTAMVPGGSTAPTELAGTVTASTPTTPTLIDPSPGSTLGATASFTFTTVSTASDYQLWVGTTGHGSGNLGVYSYGATTAGSITVPVKGLPASGTIYVRLFYEVAGAWTAIDYVYIGG